MACEYRAVFAELDLIRLIC